MYKSLSGTVSSSLFGVQIEISSITAELLLEAVTSGCLIDVASSGWDTSGAWEMTGQTGRQLRLLQGGGLEHPLVWVASGEVPSAEGHWPAVFSARLDQAGVHREILQLVTSPEFSSKVAAHQFPVILFPSLDDELEGEVRSWVARSTPDHETPAASLVRRFLAHCSPDVVASFETKFSHVPLRSKKVTSTLQLETAIRAVLTDGQPRPFDNDGTAEFLAQFWDSLRAVRPEINPSESSNRIRLRSASLATSALGIGAVFAVAVELLNRDFVWTQDTAALIATSPLRRTVPVARSVERAHNLTGHVLPQQSLAERGEHTELASIRRSLTQRLMSELVEVGWHLSPAPPFDLIKGHHGLTLGASNRARPELDGDEFDASLDAAADLYRRYRDRMDFFDIDAPWWQLGRCVTYVEQSGKIQRRQAKSVAAKQWAGQLAVRLMA